MTKEQLVAFLTKVQRVLDTLSTFIPPLAALKLAVDGILSSDFLLNVILMLINKFMPKKLGAAELAAVDAVTEEELTEAIVEMYLKDAGCDDAAKAKLKAELPKMKAALKAKAAK